MAITHLRVSPARIVALITFILALLPSPSAAAQGTFGTLPDPISTSDLMGYADRLDLSPQQRQAILTFHDQYKREFRVLREGEIADYLDQMRQAEGPSMPQRKVVEDLIKGMERLNNRIAAVDNRMLDQIQTILTEEQTADLPRVRLARERKRLQSQWVMMMTGGPGLDLSELFLNLDLTPEAMAAADPAIYQYETRLTSSLRDLRETSLNAIMELFDAMTDMGYDEETIQNAEDDPEAAAEMMEAMQNVFMQIMQKAMAASAEMKEENKKAYRTVHSLLPEPAARLFRNRYYSRSYSRAYFAIRDFADWRDIARKEESLTGEQQDAVGAIAQQLQTTYDGLVERVAEAEDAAGGMFGLAMDGQDAWQKLWELTGEAEQEAGEALESALAQVGEFAPEELVDELRRHSQRPWSEAPDAEEQEQEVASEETDWQDEWTGDWFIPSRISRRDLADHGGQLNLTETQRTIIGQLYDDYVVAFADVKDGPIQAVQEANSNLWQYEPDSGTQTSPKLEDIRRVYSLRQTAQQAINELDSTFLDDVELVLDTEQQKARLARLRLARLRQCYGVARSVSDGFGINAKPVVDLAELIRREELSPADLGPADTILVKYEKTLTEAMQTWLERAMEYQQVQEAWAVEARRLREAGDDSAFTWGTKYQEFIRQPQQALNDSMQTIAALNDSTLDDLASVLGARAAGSIRRAYARQAYPTIYFDQLAVEEHLDRALELPDLTDLQQRQLNELAAEYRSAYEGYCQQLIKLEATMPDWSAAGEDYDWQEYQNIQQKTETVRFDRNELSARASAKLQAILTKEQVRRIGGLPNPPEGDNIWGF